MFSNLNIAINCIELIQSTRNASRHALEMFRKYNFKLFETLMTDVEDAIVTIEEILKPFEMELIRTQVFNITKNIIFSIKNIEQRINLEDLDRADLILEFEVIPLLAELKEEFYFFCFIYPDKKKMAFYYEEEFAKNHQNEYTLNNRLKYEVSIVVTAWNKLDYTRQCIESLFRYTDFEKHKCELITINHGSNDGTSEYFEKLPHQKKINLEKNMSIILVPFLLRIVEGKFCVYISNDIVLTENWLENFLECAKSDNNIAFACPVTSNISNNQSIPTDYKTLDEMQLFSSKFNISNPLKWEERVRLCPAITILNMSVINKTGFFDRNFIYIEFSDDDASLSIRRKGYKLILMGDTFCHHFGSVTLKDDQVKNSSLEKSREIFMHKNDLDPWGLGFSFDVSVISALDFKSCQKGKVLGIDSGMGSTPLQIKNILKSFGSTEFALYNFATSDENKLDLRASSDHFSFGQIDDLDKVYEQCSFDFIYIGKKLEQYADYEKLLIMISKLLNKNGQFIFQVTNPYSLDSIIECAKFNYPWLREGNRSLDFFSLNGMLPKLFAGFSVTGFKNPTIDFSSDFAKGVLNLHKNNPYAQETLQILFYQYKVEG